MTENRWDSYVLISNNEIDNFWQEHFNNTSVCRTVLFIIGMGFDVRMNNVFKTLLSSTGNVEVQCLLIEYNEGANSPSHKYQDLINENMIELQELISQRVNLKLESLFIDIWKDEGRD